MAWNPSPEVQIARDAAKKLGDADQCIILALNHRTGKCRTVTYGRNKMLCDDADRLGKAAFAAIVSEMAMG